MVAPIRTRRAKKRFPFDTVTELRNSTLQAWQTDYLSNMKKQTNKRLTLSAPRVCRKNAALFTFDGGIASIGIEMRVTQRQSHPLSMFCGESLFQMLTDAGPPASTPERAGSKRRHENERESSEGAATDRRVRPRESEYGRGADKDEIGVFQDNSYLADDGDNDMEREPEQGRTMATPLADRLSSEHLLSAMPWNVSATRLGSRGPASLGSLGSLQPQRLSQQQHRPLSVDRTRVTSASPLQGHTVVPLSRQASLARGIPQQPASSSVAGDFYGGDHPDGDSGDADDPAADTRLNTQQQYDLFGPAAYVDTQTAGESQWLRSALNIESANFYRFLRQAVRERGRVLGPETSQPVAEQLNASVTVGRKESLTFEELLPPEDNTYIVATQGLFHILSLASRGIIELKQKLWKPPHYDGVTEGDQSPQGQQQQQGKWALDGTIFLSLQASSDVGGDLETANSEAEEGEDQTMAFADDS